ncbi:MAG: ATP-binding protein [Bacteroidota bacterium]
MRTSIKYALLGAFFGLLFPVISTLFDLISNETPITFSNILHLHQTVHLHLVIDTAPFFLGLFAWLAGTRQERLEDLKLNLESDLTRLFHHTNDFLLVCGTDGNILRFNQRFEEETQQTTKQLKGRPFLDFVAEDEKEAAREMLHQILAGKPVTPFEQKLKGPEGRLTEVLWSSSPALHGKFLLIGRDISDIRHTERQLREYAADLEASVAELDNFAYIISHDLKAPLRGVFTLADFIEEDLHGGNHAAIDEHLAFLRNRITRMEGMIAGVLEYTRATRAERQFAEIDLQPFFRQLIDMLALPRTFEVTWPTTPFRVIFNEIQLQQVFQNLITNAVKHHDKPQGQIKIDWEALPEGGWEFSVTDDGPGIQPKFQERVFSIFKTLKPRDTLESTGMGLAIVKKIVESSGGNINIDPKYQKGTRMIFRIFPPLPAQQ